MKGYNHFICCINKLSLRFWMVTARECFASLSLHMHESERAAFPHPSLAYLRCRVLVGGDESRPLARHILLPLDQ